MLTTHPHFVFCLFHMACIAFGCPASTPQAPFPAKRCSACTLRAVSHAGMVSNAWGSCFLIDSVRLVRSHGQAMIFLAPKHRYFVEHFNLILSVLVYCH